MSHGHDVEFTVIEEVYVGSLTIPGAWIFNSEEEWVSEGAAFESRKQLFVVPWPPPPEGIDWSKEAVVVVSAGEHPTGPCSVNIRRITQRGPEAAIEADFHGPGPVQTITTPWSIVKIDRKNIKRVTHTFRSI